jgi:hypothetical protein
MCLALWCCSGGSADPSLSAAQGDTTATGQSDSDSDDGVLDDAFSPQGDSSESDAQGTGGSTSGGTDTLEDPLAECEDELESAVSWFESAPIGPLDGTIEFGQTHIMAVDDERIGPDLVAGRESLLLFTPIKPFSAEVDVRVAAFSDGKLLGVLRMQSPEFLPSSLESSLTDTPLEPYSKAAWSASLPWNWMSNGVSLRIGVKTNAGLSIVDYGLSDLAAPHKFTLTRTHMVLFGEDSFEVVPPHAAPKIARDMAPWLPGAMLQWVDTSPWRLDRIVVNTLDGPRWANSEAERIAITTDETRWNIMKHQGALRLSLANTGRGLRYTLPPQGDNSPFSYGTSMVQGWVRLADGSYTDVNNAGLAAGWTGWSGMWLDECGNGFIHEVGHTLTLLHFTEGTAFDWGISEEYPKDGTWQPEHPWGYDTVRRRFRTWYRVDSAGPVSDNGELLGKRDPMNGGEPSNSVTCFPSYTAYQMKRSLDWIESTPTLLDLDGQPGAYRWNRTGGQYVAEPEPTDVQPVTAVGVPVATLIGTLGNTDDVCQTYPPVTVPVGNAFSLPDPLAPDLIGFSAAQWFVAVTYADGTVERGLINRAAVAETDTSLYLYSLNVELERNPQSVQLYRSATGYPNVDVTDAELVHTRDLTTLPKAQAPVLYVGEGELANDELRLRNWCEEGLNCDVRQVRSEFQVTDAQLSFKPKDSDIQDTYCGEPDTRDVWSVPVVSDSGEAAALKVYALRNIVAAQTSVNVPASDRTPWVQAANLRQSLVLFIPYELNSMLSAGTWKTPKQFMITVLRDGEVWRDIPLRIELTVHAATSVTIPPEYVSPGVAIAADAPESSIYFTFDDSNIGPSSPKWWGDDSGNLITVPVRDATTGTFTTLVLRGHKLACGSEWEINTGQSATWGCTHQVRLRLEPGANTELVSGHSYLSPPSSPVVIRGRRWHEPGSDAVLQTLALQFSYTAP